MANGKQPFANTLIAALTDSDQGKLEPFLHPISLPLQLTLFHANAPMTMLVFPESGLASVVTPKNRVVEVGLVGREGFLGWPLLLGLVSHPYRTFIQASGDGHSLKANDLSAALEAVPALRGVLHRYIGFQMVQIAQTAVCNGIHPVRQRLARWLLMSQDRIGENSLPVTHEFLAYMLSVRRPSVGDTMKLLEQAGAVHQGHGRVLILDRAKLKAESCSCYDITQAEYAKVHKAILKPNAERDPERAVSHGSPATP